MKLMAKRQAGVIFARVSEQVAAKSERMLLNDLGFEVEECRVDHKQRLVTVLVNIDGFQERTGQSATEALSEMGFTVEAFIEEVK